MRKPGKSGVDDNQIGCNLDRHTAGQLASYAKLCEVSRSKLLALLVLREVRVKRLGSLRSLYAGSDERSDAVRVTTRMTTPARRDAFKDRVADLGMRIEDGLALLARAELEEAWFARTLKTPESELILASSESRNE